MKTPRSRAQPRIRHPSQNSAPDAPNHTRRNRPEAGVRCLPEGPLHPHRPTADPSLSLPPTASRSDPSTPNPDQPGPSRHHRERRNFGTPKFEAGPQSTCSDSPFPQLLFRFQIHQRRTSEHPILSPFPPPHRAHASNPFHASIPIDIQPKKKRACIVRGNEGHVAT